MHQSEETATEAEPQRRAVFRLNSQRCIIKLQLFQRRPQIAVLLPIGRIQPGEYHRLQRHIPRQRFGGGHPVNGQRIAHRALPHILEPGGDITHLPGFQPLGRPRRRSEYPHLNNFGRAPRRHHPDAVQPGYTPILYPDVRDDPLILVIYRIKHQRPRRRRRLAAGGRNAPHHRVQNGRRPGAFLGRHEQHFIAPETEYLLDFPRHPLRLRLRQVHLVQHRNQIQVILHRQQSVGDGLRLNALAGVHHQQRPLAGRQRPRHLIAEIHMTGGVDQVQLIGLPVRRLVIHRHRFALDRNPPLPLQLHLVQELRLHLLRADGAGDFQKPVGQRGLAVVDVRDDAEISDV